MSSSDRTKRNIVQSASTTVLLILLLLTVIGAPAMAGRNAGGAMLLHVDNALVYSQLQPYCDDVRYPLPATCDALVTNVTHDPSVNSMVWMVAAFATGSSPGVNAYQVGLTGDIPIDSFQDFAPCGPGFFEIPDAGWPGSGSGTAVAYSSTVNSTLFKMYWFAVGAPGVGSSMSTTNYFNGDRHAEWADDSTPPLTDFCSNFGTVTWGGPGSKNCPTPPQAGACCFADGHCADLLQDDCVAQGGTWEGAGTTCATFQCPSPTGACCFHDGHCTILTSAQCAAQGGAYQGNATACNPNPCPPPTGACCFPDGTCQDMTQVACSGVWEGMDTACATFQCPQPAMACCFADGSCQDLTADQCVAQGGTSHPEGTCDSVTCLPPQTGACCVGQTCTIETAASCAAAGGVYKGDGSTCEPQNPCVPAPTGACCFADNHCDVLTQAACQQEGANYRGDGTSCDPNPCASTGACCLGGYCAILAQEQCQQQGGNYLGDNTSCFPNPCCVPRPRHIPAIAGQPASFVRGSGGHNVVGMARDVCWSEPADLNGLIGSSEQILSLGIETELANDFVPTGEISHATWWGGYYNNSTPCQSGITTPGFNLRIYNDAGCLPGTILADIAVTDFTEVSVGCQAGTYPMFQWDADIEVGTIDGNLYWFGAQIRDHPFPPQGGRLAAAVVTGCDTVFKSAYFGFPCWTPAIDVFGVAFDCSQEFECGIDTRTGACCFQDGHCIVLGHAACNQQGGRYQGHDTLCEPNPCPAGGACCFADGHCAIHTQSVCQQQGGQYMGDNILCTPSPCGPSACCLHGACVNLVEEDCTNQGGQWKGYGTSCAAIQCPPGGACCLGDGSCLILTQNECSQSGGQYQGDNTTCDPNPCPQPQACCFADGSCAMSLPEPCMASGGTPQGKGTVCDPNPCPQPPGACCFHDGQCAIETRGACDTDGGVWQGMDTFCDPNPCPLPTGACCFHDGHCVEATQSECASQGGAWQGMDTVCNPNPCLQPTGACCFVDGHCELLTQIECLQQGASYQGMDAPCDPNPCAHTGACCFGDGHCTIFTTAQCEQQGGSYFGDGITCNPNPCPQPSGACCFTDERCTILTRGECQQQGGSYRGDGSTCTPNPCTQTGACCIGTACTILTQARCQEEGGRYLGDNTSCSPSPCCSSASGQRSKNGIKPTLFVRGGGDHNVVRSVRDICWSEPADLNGLIGSSEVILSLGLETELANDFVPTDTVTGVTFWGGFYNNSTPCASGITICGFNLRFYDDAGCIPGTLIDFIAVTHFTEQSVGCQAGTYPMFKWSANVNVPLTSGNLYWFGAQIADHPFPPQGGRLAAAVVTSCDTVFKSVYFGYPDWMPAIDVFGVAFDCSQEFICGAGGVPTKKTTWGHIKSLYH